MRFLVDWVKFSAAILEPEPRSSGWRMFREITEAADLLGSPEKNLKRSLARVRL